MGHDSGCKLYSRVLFYNILNAQGFSYNILNARGIKFAQSLSLLLLVCVWHSSFNFCCIRNWCLDSCGESSYELLYIEDLIVKTWKL